MYSNELIHESSPYLLQHAHNPVDWHPWGENAFALARLADKPVFLSIGYSTCHWCHVMERECFSDAEVAEEMNRSFVNIKVDREERPDIDQVYMQAAQMMTGAGGWPLNVLLTPEGKPFYAATYMPKHSGHGRIGLIELSQRVRALWKSDRQSLLASAERLHQALQEQQHATAKEEELSLAWVEQAYQRLRQDFDAEHGGFGNAPKFPTPHKLMLLLRYASEHPRSEALAMVERSLDHMRAGGIFDHLGFGFHRYATDARWLVPHFEKMLYDQAMLMLAYSEAYQLTGHARHARVVEEIADYVLRRMHSEDGLFFSAEDADSEGEEGRFYLWTEEEIRQALGPEDADLAIRHWHIEPRGNYLDEARRLRNGRNILHTGISQTQDSRDQARIESIRERLLQIREQRPQPFRDTKILCDWNGLMIGALARASLALERKDWYDIASQAGDQLLRRLRDTQGRLWHTRQGDTGVPAHLDDYAFAVFGLLELYEAGFDAHFLQAAMELNESMLAHFADPRGGFFLTADDAESLLVRPREAWDGALPSGNAMAAYNLLRLGRLSGNMEWEAQALRSLRAFSGSMQQAPTGQTFMLIALWQALRPGHELVIAGEAKAATEAGREIQRGFFPNLVVLRRDPQSMKLAPHSQAQTPLRKSTTFYLCSNRQCQAPTHDIEQVRAALEAP